MTKSGYSDAIDMHELLAKHFSSISGQDVNRINVLYALLMRLGDKYDIEHPVNAWDLPVNFAGAVKVLEDFDFSSFHNPIHIENSVFSGQRLFNTKATIKAAGQIWIIHRYDADPFPSNPHAHNAEQNIKLSLSNGKCFRNRTYLETIRKKNLLLIRNLAKEKYKGLLPELEC